MSEFEVGDFVLAISEDDEKYVGEIIWIHTYNNSTETERAAKLSFYTKIPSQIDYLGKKGYLREKPKGQWQIKLLNGCPASQVESIVVNPPIRGMEEL